MIVRTFIALAITAAPVAAQQRAQVIEEVARCRGIADATARLACFDAAAGRLDKAITAKDLTVLDREGVKRTRRSLFGYSLPPSDVFAPAGREKADEEVSEVNATISRVVPSANGRYELVLDTGARWQSTEPMNFPPRAGAKVRIRKAALGSYLISIAGERTVRGRRIG